MSELSPVYSEYEKVSNLFRCLNEATLVARQTRLGIKTPTLEEEVEIQHDLESALDQLNYENTDESINSFPGMLSELENDDMDISPRTISSIRHRLSRGLRALTEEDLEIIEKVTDVLDSTSELLFRRIQK